MVMLDGLESRQISCLYRYTSGVLRTTVEQRTTLTGALAWWLSVLVVDFSAGSYALVQLGCLRPHQMVHSSDTRQATQNHTQDKSHTELIPMFGFRFSRDRTRTEHICLFWPVFGGLGQRTATFFLALRSINTI